MPNWIITPKKYLTDEETKRLRNTLNSAAQFEVEEVDSGELGDLPTMLLKAVSIPQQ